MNILQPASWAKPKGYANGICARGQLVFVAGQIGWDEHQKFRTTDFVGQCRQALLNIAAVLREAGAHPGHIVRMTWFVVDKAEYLQAGPALGECYREIMGRHYPAMTAVQVSALIENDARVEIEATAVIPDSQPAT